MSLDRLKMLLDNRGVKYQIMSHAEAYTAQETAAHAHVPGKELAKVVMIKLDGKICMAVLPATHKVDLKQLAEESGAKKAELAAEEEFRDKFPDCEVGAMPPFGNLYGFDVYVAAALAADEEIAFSAGSHYELMKLSFSDFERIVRPRILKFAAKA